MVVVAGVQAAMTTVVAAGMMTAGMMTAAPEVLAVRVVPEVLTVLAGMMPVPLTKVEAHRSSLLG